MTTKPQRHNGPAKRHGPARLFSAFHWILWVAACGLIFVTALIAVTVAAGLDQLTSAIRSKHHSIN